MDTREVLEVEDGEEDCRREDVDQEEFCYGRVGEAGGEHSVVRCLWFSGRGECWFVAAGWARVVRWKDEVWLLLNLTRRVLPGPDGRHAVYSELRHHQFILIQLYRGRAFNLILLYTGRLG